MQNYVEICRNKSDKNICSNICRQLKKQKKKRNKKNFLFVKQILEILRLRAYTKFQEIFKENEILLSLEIFLPGNN